MHTEARRPEGREVAGQTIKLFSRVAALAALPAAWRVRQILKGKIKPGDRVLDVGTGPATIPLFLKKFFPETSFTGLDVSPAMLREALKHNRRQSKKITLLAGDGGRLPIADRSLDGIISFFTLHHMDEPAFFLKEAARVIKPDGFFLLIDFRRDMPRSLFRIMNAAWQTIFLCSSGRTGFKESVESAWHPDEIEAVLTREKIDRFHLLSTRTELIITLI